MEPREVTPAQAQVRLDAAVGRRTWGVFRGVGSFLVVPIGEPVRRAGEDEPRRGSVHLWVEHAVWRVEDDEGFLALAEDDREHLAAAARRLDDRVVEQLVVDPRTHDLRLVLSGGVVLQTFGLRSSGDDTHWSVMLGAHEVLESSPGRRLTLGPSGGDVEID